MSQQAVIEAHCRRARLRAGRRSSARRAGCCACRSIIPPATRRAGALHHGRRLRARHAPAAACAGGRRRRLRAPRGVVARPRPAAEERRRLRAALPASEVEVDAEAAVQGPQALSRRAASRATPAGAWCSRRPPPRRGEEHAASRSAQARAAAAAARLVNGRRSEGAGLFAGRGARGAPRAGDRFQGAPVRARPARGYEGARRSEETDGGRTQ